MSLKQKYFLFILLIHALIGYLCYLLLQDQKLYFLAVEIAVLFSLFLAYRLYLSFIKPLDFIASGTDAIRDQDFNVKFLETGSKEMDKLIHVYNEMIDHIREERTQVEEQHFFLEKLIQASPAGIVFLNYDDRVAAVNPKAAKLLQWKAEWLNQKISKIDHPLLQQIALLPVGKGNILQYKGVEQYKCEVSGFIHKGFHKKFIIIQELSKEILAAEKRAYGKVIRMMAHEVNNSIGAINSILNSTLDYNEGSSQKLDPDILHALEAAVDRNNSLNQFMKNFAEVVRLPTPVLEACDLNMITQRIITLMSPQARKQNIQVEQQLHPSPIPVSIDAKQIEQALVNIFKNAIEAIEKEEGVIRLETFSHPRARIVISDNGSGIDSEVASKLFTPFFSTKMTGQGVGLTLIRDILGQHNAHFSLETKEGWTRFEISF